MPLEECRLSEVLDHSPTLRAVGLLQQAHRVDAESLRESLERLQGQVALPALDTAHEGAVHADLVGEFLLAQAALPAQASDVAADDVLQVTFHIS
jgi:hypothetical protein